MVVVTIARTRLLTYRSCTGACDVSGNLESEIHFKSQIINLNALYRVAHWQRSCYGGSHRQNIVRKYPGTADALEF